MQPQQIYIASGILVTSVIIALVYYDLSNLFKFDDKKED